MGGRAEIRNSKFEIRNLHKGGREFGLRYPTATNRASGVQPVPQPARKVSPGEGEIVVRQLGSFLHPADNDAFL